MEWKTAKLSEHKNTMFHRYLKCGKVEINKTECRNGCRNMCIKGNKRNKRDIIQSEWVKMDVGKMDQTWVPSSNK